MTEPKKTTTVVNITERVSPFRNVLLHFPLDINRTFSVYAHSYSVGIQPTTVDL